MHLDLGARTLPIDLVRLAGREPEAKDPNLVRRPDGGWVMYASVGRSATQDWLIGRFVADTRAGPWVETEAVRLEGLSGPTVCAPAVVPEDDGWVMYIQTGCFEPGAHIATARSRDGSAFTVAEAAVPADGHALVYDAGAREVVHEGRRLRVLLYTACDRVGRGDLWGRTLDDDGWSAPRLVLAESAVPFHNHPDAPDREWALEGAEVVQIGEGLYLLVGVCFLPTGPRGTRQRVFLAAAREPLGPYVPMGCPIAPQGAGETGHPSAVVDGDELHLLYQERAGDDPHPWHLRWAAMTLADVTAAMLAALAPT